MENKTVKKKIRLPWRTVIIAIVMVYAVFVFADQQKKLNAANERHAELVSEDAEVEAEKNYTEHKRDFVDTDDYVEQSVRDRLNWVRDGEIIFYDSTENGKDE